ncbi:MAG: hypothetical protein AB8H80_03785 [Planctomycetota bacterium]
MLPSKTGEEQTRITPATALSAGGAGLSAGGAGELAEISGYSYNKVYALGTGVLTYHNKHATWDSEGTLESWHDTFGIGWGLIYSHRSAGEGDSRKTQSAKILSGLLGYTEEQGKGYLHLLWIPIPW